jgi:hypothetical protein
MTSSHFPVQNFFSSLFHFCFLLSCPQCMTPIGMGYWKRETLERCSCGVRWVHWGCWFLSLNQNLPAKPTEKIPETHFILRINGGHLSTRWLGLQLYFCHTELSNVTHLWNYFCYIHCKYFLPQCHMIFNLTYDNFSDEKQVSNS